MNELRLETNLETMNGLDDVVMDKAYLISIIKLNKEKHDNIYNESISTYTSRAIKIITEQLERLKEDPTKGFHVSLPYPISYSHEYDRAINKLSNSIHQRVHLNANDYSKFVENNWSWKANFINTSSMYCDGETLKEF